MNDFSIPISTFFPAQPVDQRSMKSGDSIETIGDTFQQMLMVSMLSGASSSDEGSVDTSMLLLPLMLSLLEKLMEQQVEAGKSEESPSAKVNASALRSEGEVSPLRSRPSSQPEGRPVSTGRLTQGYHGTHYALDIGIPVGTPIKTTMDGKVVYAGWNNEGYGNLVIVENGPYRTYYAHLSEIPVRIGDAVTAGNTVGLSGNTGNSTGPHLHYEVRYQMRPIDPTSFTL